MHRRGRIEQYAMHLQVFDPLVEERTQVLTLDTSFTGDFGHRKLNRLHIEVE